MANERLEEMKQRRLAIRQRLLDQGKTPYPTEVQRSHTVQQILDAFDTLSATTELLTITGRVMAKRSHGGVVFLDLRDASGTLQIQVTKDDVIPDIFAYLDNIDVGDIIQVVGTLIVSQRGVKTLAAREYHLLTKSIHPLPSTWYGLKDHEARFRQREVDFILNDDARKIITTRSHIITWLRRYMTDAGYLEVETPVLQPIHGGAAARPFTTHHHALDITLHLRIAAELYLKRLLAAGFEKVFEIERRFRNEGIDRQHNPEFTMLEAQWAYADYEDLMDVMEQMLAQLCQDIVGTTTVTWQEHSLSFTAPLTRVRYVDIMNKKLGVDILTEKDPNTYLALFKKHQLTPPDSHTYYQLVDELYKELVRPTLIQPTFLYDYPSEFVPLAKPNLTDPRFAEKFQLLAAGMELGNNYTEQNDPVAQRAALETQQVSREAGDEEAHTLDNDYLRAMEYGMPPNVGWGIGIDRLVMILTNAPSIRDVIAFPLLRPRQDEIS